MINRIIDICAKNKFLVLLFIGVAVLIGWHSMKNTKLDAIPDLSDTQVIVYAKWDRSPDIIEDQLTYPITSALLGMPKVKDIRGFSDFGFSYIYIIFDEGTDLYWARSRTLEYLNAITAATAQRCRPSSWPRTRPASAGSMSTLWSMTPASTAWSRCAATRIGICATPCNRCPEWPRSHRWAASFVSIR